MLRTSLSNVNQDNNDNVSSVNLPPKLPYLEAISDSLAPPAFNLKSVTVNYVNRSLEGQYGLTFHGYIAVGGKPSTIKISSARKRTLKNQHGMVFYLGGYRNYVPYDVSEALLKQVEASSEFSEKSKKLLREMSGKKFPTAENFLQEFIFKRIEKSEDEISDTLRKNLYLLAMDPYLYKELITKLDLPPENKNELKILLKLNRKLHSRDSIIFPYSIHSDFSFMDAYAFENNQCYISEYPSINPTKIYELFQNQQLYQRYIEEKLSMGESFDREEKKPESGMTHDVDRIKNRLVGFYTHTLFDNPFYANCNKGTATLLQEAEYLCAAEQKREPTLILVGASNLSFGSNQRMFFWGSRLQRTVADLFVNRDIAPDDQYVKLQLENLQENTTLFQELVDKKYFILQIIQTWPKAQEKRALTQILDQSTPLGKVFVSSRSGMFRRPDPSRGALNLAQQRLKALVDEDENKIKLKI